jgi:predicted pyridoxine 5'-phosphate oxidase superfamily flavin-nucleotide-binding protein
MHSPYALLKTINHAEHTELSPRGDEPGFIQHINNNTIFMPERPGNKVAVSLRNIIQNPNIELLVMVPGYSQTQNIHGHAYVTTDSELLEPCTVNGKKPKIGIVIKVISKHFQVDKALLNSKIWDASQAVDKTTLTAFPKALSSHMNGTGLLGKATNKVVEAIVKHDMKNLY